jgi:hypothetical protein
MIDGFFRLLVHKPGNGYVDFSFMRKNSYVMLVLSGWANRWNITMMVMGKLDGRKLATCINTLLLSLPIYPEYIYVLPYIYVVYEP